jgi:4-hydroxy-2-oxoheptanedioate aldolase
MHFREKLSSGKAVFGPFMKTTDPAFVEAAGYAGFDFAVLDLEHGPVSFQQLQNLIRATEVSGIFPIVRTPPGNLHQIGAVQDIGAGGVMVPQVLNAREATKAIKSAKFHPRGERGVCAFVRAAKYSTTDSQVYFKEANKNIIILQLEGTEALENVDEIMEVPDVDILFIGPYDLSQSLGVPGQVNHPRVITSMQKIIKKAKAKGLTIGTYVANLDNARLWREAGVQFIGYSVDVAIFVEASQSLVNQLKAGE